MSRIAVALGSLVVLFAILVALRLHGFSLPIWRERIDGTAAPEVLLGRPREVRIDDYAVILPLAFAQEAHDPPFPVVNTLVGQGQNMLLPFSLPVAHPLALFKPDTWGFFLGADFGMAWRWWSRALGLFAISGLLLLVVTGGDRALAGLGAFALVASPFLQFWTLRPAPVSIHAGVLVLAALALAFARRRRWILLAGAAAGYSAVGFGLTLYPPFQVPLAYLALLLLATLALSHRDALALRERPGWRLAALALAALITAVGAALLVSAAGDAIDRTMHTAYPGRRLSLGGGRSLATLLAANTGLPLLVDDYGRLLNACEAAGYWLLSPALALGALWSWLAGGRRPDAVALGLAAAVVALVLHASTTMPVWLARATLFGLVPGYRSVIALGFADVLLVARLLAYGSPLAGVPRTGAALLWGGGVAAAVFALQRTTPALPIGAGLGFAAGNSLLAWLALAPRRRWHAMAALAAASALVSLWFNPLVRGGSDALRDNSLARAVLEIDRAYAGGTSWVAYGGHVVPNLFRAIGVHSVNGVHPVPQLELWAPFDPSGEAQSIYNRYAHVVFDPDAGEEPTFDRRGSDTFTVHVRPGSEALHKLGVTHLLVDSPKARSLAERDGATWLKSVGPFSLLRAPWTPEPPAQASPRRLRRRRASVCGSTSGGVCVKSGHRAAAIAAAIALGLGVGCARRSTWNDVVVITRRHAARRPARPLRLRPRRHHEPRPLVRRRRTVPARLRHVVVDLAERGEPAHGPHAERPPSAAPLSAYRAGDADRQRPAPSRIPEGRLRFERGTDRRGLRHRRALRPLRRRGRRARAGAAGLRAPRRADDGRCARLAARARGPGATPLPLGPLHRPARALPGARALEASPAPSRDGAGGPRRILAYMRPIGVHDALDYVDRYDEEVGYTDEHVDRLLRGLEAQRGLDRTLVVFTADHGESLTERDLWFRHGWHVYEELIRVPLLLRGPGVQPGESQTPVSSLDVAPTILLHAGVPPPAGWSAADLRRPDAVPADRTLFAEASLADGRWLAALRGTRKVMLEAWADGRIGPSLFVDLATTPGEESSRKSEPGDPLAAEVVARAAHDERPLASTAGNRGDGKPAPGVAPQVTPEAAAHLRSLGYLE